MIAPLPALCFPFLRDSLLRSAVRWRQCGLPPERIKPEHLPGDKGAEGGARSPGAALDRGHHRSILLSFCYDPISTGANGEDDMAVRLVVTITAAPGKGSELAQAYKVRCEECMKEPGCEQ